MKNSILKTFLGALALVALSANVEAVQKITVENDIIGALPVSAQEMMQNSLTFFWNGTPVAFNDKVSVAATTGACEINIVYTAQEDKAGFDILKKLKPVKEAALAVKACGIVKPILAKLGILSQGKSTYTITLVYTPPAGATSISLLEVIFERIPTIVVRLLTLDDKKDAEWDTKSIKFFE